MNDGYHSLMPEWAQDLLRKAAATEPTDMDPRARDKAVEAAEQEIRLHCSWVFRGHDNHVGRDR